MTATPTTSAVDLDQILDQITATKAQIDLLQGRLAGLQDQLSAACDAGDIDATFSHNDWSFRLSPGRTTWKYSAATTAQIKALQAADKAIGAATQTTGAAFWTIKAPTI